MFFSPLFGGCKYTNNFLFINKNPVFQHFALLITCALLQATRLHRLRTIHHIRDGHPTYLAPSPRPADFSRIPDGRDKWRDAPVRQFDRSGDVGRCDSDAGRKRARQIRNTCRFPQTGGGQKRGQNPKGAQYQEIKRRRGKIGFSNKGHR